LIKLSERVAEGDLRAIELWLAYLIGKPMQKTDITTNGKEIQLPQIKWGENEI